MDEKLAIKVQIAERFYPLKIERKEEEKIRKAASSMGDSLIVAGQRYTDKDPQDFLAMAALQFVIQLIDCDSNQNLLSLEKDLRSLNDELNDILKEE